ncbi:MAG: AraC family transcriptional regulator [Betaproteobacteria bacterium]|nr:AraC family transcriptional regulator [Betaproteobacteria bacterium]
MKTTKATENAPGNAQRNSVASAFVTGMLAGAVAHGFEPAALLTEVGIDAAALHDPAARVPLVQYGMLYECVATTLDDEAFGLFSVPMRVGSFEFLCRGALSAATLEEALQRICRFLHLVLPDVAVSLRRGAASAELLIEEVRPLTVQRVFAFEWLLRLIHGIACWLIARSIALDEVDFPYPQPDHATDYALIYTAHSHFDAARLAARFAPELLDQALRRDEAALAHFLSGGPGRLTMLYRRDREFAARVRDVLRETLLEPPSQDEVAERLHLSPRTLARRLALEGSSFRAILDTLRRELALARITQTHMPVDKIAAELGYADPSAFYRAFVAWTGQSPSAYRRMHAPRSV